MRGKISCLLLATMLVASALMVNIGFAQPDPTIYIDPAVSNTNPTEDFTVTVSIMDAVGVAAWEVSLTWDLTLTAFPPVVTEGSFLSDVGFTVFQYTPDILLGKIGIAAFVFGGTASGSGVLAEVTFSVTGSGSSVIDLFDTKLFDASVTPIAHTAVDGLFQTTAPGVEFTITPPNPLPGELVTFDGSASFSPVGRTLVSYDWNFGDGDTDSGMIVTHTYADYQVDGSTPYEVTLTVTDDASESASKTKDLRIWRDVVVGPVWYDPTWWLDLNVRENALGASPLMHIAVANLGTVTETFDLNVWAVHDETGYEPIVVPFWDNPVTVDPGSGMGFGSLFFWMASGDDLPGTYTIYAEAIVSDTDTSNNMDSLQIRLGESNLIMARPDTRHFDISDRGTTTMNLFGKAKNIEKVATDPMGLYTWIRFEVLTPDDELLILDTNDEFIFNEEETSILTTSLEVEPGIYSFTAYAVFSVMPKGSPGSYGTTLFYEADLDWLPLSGSSVKMKTFTVNVVP